MATRHATTPARTATTPAVAPGHQVATGWVRATALGGLAFFGLLLVFATLTSNSPAANDTRNEFYAYVASNHDRLQWAAVVYAWAMPAALLFVTGLFAALRRAEGGRARLAVAALAGGVLAAAATLIGALVLGTVATRFLDLGPAGTRVLWTAWQLSFGAILAGQVLMIGSTAAVGWSGRLFPRWFVLASIVLTLLSAAGVLALGFTSAGVQTAAVVTVLLNAVWSVLVSLHLMRHPELAAEPS
jgi:hypothetical protein